MKPNSTGTFSLVAAALFLIFSTRTSSAEHRQALGDVKEQTWTNLVFREGFFFKGGEEPAKDCSTELDDGWCRDGGGEYPICQYTSNCQAIAEASEFAVAWEDVPNASDCNVLFSASHVAGKDPNEVCPSGFKDAFLEDKPGEGVPDETAGSGSCYPCYIV